MSAPRASSLVVRVRVRVRVWVWVWVWVWVRVRVRVRVWAPRVFVGGGAPCEEPTLTVPLTLTS